jgi:hypothetical protein
MYKPCNRPHVGEGAGPWPERLLFAGGLGNRRYDGGQGLRGTVSDP